VKYYVHFALDMFGAEFMGRFRTWEALLDHDGSRHLNIWAGPGSAPTNNDYWSEQFPVWDDTFPPPILQGEGLELDRQACAQSERALTSSDAGQKKLLDFALGWPDRLLGRQHGAEPVFVICGSLAEPASSGLLLGLLAAFGDLRRTGTFRYPVYVLVSCGAQSGSLIEHPSEARALVAQCLYELQDFFAKAEDDNVAAPVYLVGENSFQGVDSDRSSQAALCAMTLVALTRIRQPVARDPFEFWLDDGGIAHFAGSRYAADRPFCVVGGYAVWCPAKRLSRLIAARVAAAAFESLAAQPDCGTLAKAEEILLNDSQAAFLDEVEASASRRIWGEAGGAKTGMVAPALWFDLEQVRALYGHVLGQEDWRRVIAAYGEERLRSTPMEAWDAEVDEMIALIEGGVLPRRRQQLDLITRRALLSFICAVEAGIARVFTSTFTDPVHAEPHRMAQAFLGRIQRRLLEKKSALEREQAIRRASAVDLDALKNGTNALRKQFSQELREVPGPVAVLVRLLPVFALAEGLFLALPVDLGLLNSAAARLASGTVLGCALSGVLFMHAVENIRRRLLSFFLHWQADYQAVLEAEDEALRNATYSGLLDSMLDCLQWLFNGKEDQPPVPEPVRAIVRHQQESSQSAEPERMRPQAVLSRFTEYLRAASAGFAELADRFLHDYQSSRVERALPDVSPETADVAASEYRLVIAAREGETEQMSAMRFIESASVSLRAEPSESQWTLPYMAQPETYPTLWRDAFHLPTGAELLDPEIRRGSSAFQVLETLCRHIGERLSSAFDLSGRLQSYQSERRTSSILQTELYDCYCSRSRPSMKTTAGTNASFVVGAGAADTLAANERVGNSLGNGRLSLKLQVCLGVQADEAIWFPNSRGPSEALGRAWAIHKRHPFTGRALNRVNL
jgi:hypothetical protein